jgi:hypothetical protein
MTHGDPHLRSKADLQQLMRRLGLPEETIAEISAQLPDPVDLDAAGPLLLSYGLTRDAVISRLGGSP